MREILTREYLALNGWDTTGITCMKEIATPTYGHVLLQIYADPTKPQYSFYAYFGNSKDHDHKKIFSLIGVPLNNGSFPEAKYIDQVEEIEAALMRHDESRTYLMENFDPNWREAYYRIAPTIPEAIEKLKSMTKNFVGRK